MVTKRKLGVTAKLVYMSATFPPFVWCICMYTHFSMHLSKMYHWVSMYVYPFSAYSDRSLSAVGQLLHVQLQIQFFPHQGQTIRRPVDLLHLETMSCPTEHGLQVMFLPPVLFPSASMSVVSPNIAVSHRTVLSFHSLGICECLCLM